MIAKERLTRTKLLATVLCIGIGCPAGLLQAAAPASGMTPASHAYVDLLRKSLADFAAKHHEARRQFSAKGFEAFIDAFQLNASENTNLIEVARAMTAAPVVTHSPLYLDFTSQNGAGLMLHPLSGGRFLLRDQNSGKMTVWTLSGDPKSDFAAIQNWLLEKRSASSVFQWLNPLGLEAHASGWGVAIGVALAAAVVIAGYFIVKSLTKSATKEVERTGKAAASSTKKVGDSIAKGIDKLSDKSGKLLDSGKGLIDSSKNAVDAATNEIKATGKSVRSAVEDAGNSLNH